MKKFKSLTYGAKVMSMTERRLNFEEKDGNVQILK